jgi:hypothetical protein
MGAQKRKQRLKIWIIIIKSYGGVAMFKFKTTKQRLQEERRKNEALNAQLVEVTDALLELAELAAAQDDALIELAEITAESGTESEV